MKKSFNKVWIALIMAFAVMVSPTLTSAATSDQTIDYVALGDSLAAGQTPTIPGQTPVFGEGYAGFIANQIDETGALASFHKEFAVSGYTTSNVLDDIVANVEKQSKDGVTSKIQDVIKNAEVITLDAGANDLLHQLDIDKEKGKITADPNKVKAALTVIGTNTSKIIAEIQRINPNADLYLMGYYNPFPHLSDDQQLGLQYLLSQLNSVLKQTATTLHVTFVSTAQSFGKNAISLLPYPQDIHPNELGYLALANDFWSKMSLFNQVTFTDHVSTETKDAVMYLAKKGIISSDAHNQVHINGYVNRLDTAIMLKKAIVFNNIAAPNPKYKDISENATGYASVAKLTEQGIFSGANGYFNPNGQLTRAQLAKVIVEAFHLSGSSNHRFKDTKGNGLESYINILVTNKVINGYVDGTFKPYNKITKAQFALILSRVLNK